MRLILGRHGNTFTPAEKAVWIGARSDLPLVAAGCVQARRLGQVLRDAKVALAAIYCGSLQRTRRHAEIVAQQAGAPLTPIIAPALVEIDYGQWEGLSSEEISAKYGSEELEAWEQHSIWPRSAGWRPSEEVVARRITEFARSLVADHGEDEVVLAITSNGILRYALRLAPGAFDAHVQARNVKVATGHVCVIEGQPCGYHVVAWNRLPEPALFER